MRVKKPKPPRLQTPVPDPHAPPSSLSATNGFADAADYAAAAIQKGRAQRRQGAKPANVSRPSALGASAPLRETPPILLHEGKSIDIAELHENAYNPRQDFPAAEIEELAASIRAYGLLEPIVVRTRGDHAGYEIVAGERRYRAAIAAGLATVRCTVLALDDRQAREVCLLENLQRKDLSAIEEAQAYQSLLEGAGAPGQAALAARLGITQGQVSNRLRLLKLPKKVQGLIISGEMPASTARALAAHADQPALGPVMEHIVTGMAQRGFPRGEEFAAEFWDEVEYQTKPLEGEAWAATTGARVPVFTPTDQERQALGVIAMPGHKKGTTLERATNVKLWQQLQDKHAAAWVKAHKNGSTKAAKGTKGERPAPDAPRRTLSAEEERQRKRKLAQQRSRRIEELATHWLRWLLSRRIVDFNLTSRDEVAAMLLEACTQWPVQGYHHGRNGPEPTRTGSVYDRAAGLLCKCFWDRQEPMLTVDAPRVRKWARELGLDLAAAWKEHQFGPLSEALWRTLGKGRVLELREKMAMPAQADAKAAQLIAALVEIGGGVPMPAEVLKFVEAGKRGPKKRK